VNRGEKPAVISALIKYQTTERIRRSINDGMDLHAGRAVSDGPANYLQSRMLPVA
jgi:acyl-CoA dehydrogenase